MIKTVIKKSMIIIKLKTVYIDEWNYIITISVISRLLLQKYGAKMEERQKNFLSKSN